MKKEITWEQLDKIENFIKIFVKFIFWTFIVYNLYSFVSFVGNELEEKDRIIEHTKTTSFNSCMKTYKKDYIKNQGTFTLMQERKLNQNLEKININGSYSSALSFGSGKINTTYINKIYEPTKFEKDNDWTNNCRKQKQVSKQVDLILKDSK